MTFNRDERRKWEKQFKQKTTKLFPIDQGECAFCSDKVFAPEGQAMIFYDGKPTHKQCRKNLKHDLGVVPRWKQ